MPQTQITCPSCGHQFEATDALTSQIKNHLETEYQTKLKTQEQSIKDEMNKKWETLEKQRQQELVTEKEKIQKELIEKAEKAKQEALNKVDLEMKDLKAQNEENQKRLAEFTQRELDLRKQTRELEEQKKNMELENARKLDQERKIIEEKIKLEQEEQKRLELAEKDKQLEQLKKSLEEANRRANQGSQQIQGDVQENDLKEILTSHFHFDQIEDVPTGIKGADLIHSVCTNFGQHCGKILWESKRTQRWSEDWVQKLKDDQASTQADIAIIATQVLPDGIKTYGPYKGIWIVQYNSHYILALTAALRHHIQEMYQLKNSQVGRDEKMEYLYSYLTGNQFRNKIENIVEAFSSMKSDLESEKRAMQKIWSKREKEITRVIDSTSNLYGDLQGIIGSKLESINQLELGGEVDENYIDGQIF
jgi:hypothetical protein